MNMMVTILILINGGWAEETAVPKSVAIGTTSIGSVTYVISVGIADLISKHAGINAIAEVGGGADAIARLLRDGKVQKRSWMHSNREWQMGPYGQWA